jgi:membrane protease YdiL (CAAX protease family)
MKPNQPNIITIIIALVVFMIGIRGIQTFSLKHITDIGKESLELTYLIKSGFNFIYVLGGYWAIKKYKLGTLGGLGRTRFKNGWLLLFPLYLVLLNFDTDLNFDSIPATRYAALGLLTLSIGFSEEYLLRAFLQSEFLKRYGISKKGIIWSVLGAAFIFGLLHLVKFDKGLYGEIGQVCFATFIGVMFGAILLRTHKIWPLVMIHALIDFAAKIDELPIVEKIVESTEEVAKNPDSGLSNMIAIILITIPCLIYGLLLLRKVTVEDILQKRIKQ